MASDVNMVPGRAAKALAIVTLAGFWVLPVAPLAALGAVKLTADSAGWARRAAVAGAVLCSAYTLAMAAGLIRLYLLIPG